MGDFLPKSEAGLMVYASNFAARTLAAPATYGLVAGDAEQIKDAADAYAAKYTVAAEKTTRNAVSIIQKNEAKQTLIAILRAYARRIKANNAVETSSKAELGLGVDDFVRTPIPAPSTRPQITISGVDARQHQLSFADVTTPQSRLKPAGVEGLHVYCHVGDAPPAEPLASRFHRMVTRQPLEMLFTPGDVGKTAYYYARWYTRTGLVGPMSQVATMTVAG